MELREVASCNDISQFIEFSNKYLQNPSRSEFAEYLKLFGKKNIQFLVSNTSVDLVGVATRVRELSFSLLIESGELPDAHDLFVAVLFERVKLEPSASATQYIGHVSAGLASNDIGDLEKVYFAIFEFYLYIINGESKNGFGNFLRRLAVLHMHECSSSQIHEQIWDIFDALSFTSGEFFEAVAPLFEKSYYFSLQSYQRRSICNWSLHVFWAIKAIFNHAAWSQFYPAWKELLYAHIERDECDEVMYLQFFIYHVMGNSYQTQDEWKEFNESISKKTSAYYFEWAKRHSVKQCKSENGGDGKKLIGLLRDRVVQNAPFKVEYSVFKALMGDRNFTDKYDVVIYNMDYIEKSDSAYECIRMFEELGIRVINEWSHLYSAGYYHSHLQKAQLIREKIIEDGVDILITQSAGYDINDFITTVRSAPKQILWIHGNFEYDVPNIDKRITHIPHNTRQKQSDYTVEHFEYQTDEMFTKPEEDRYRELARVVRSYYPKDVVLLGSIGRLVKVDSDDYIYAVSEVLKQCPNAIYLACGEGNREGIEAKLVKYGVDRDKFVFVGWVDPHVYGYVLDVYLNTFPESSGEALVEFLAKGNDKYVVSLSND